VEKATVRYHGMAYQIIWKVPLYHTHTTVLRPFFQDHLGEPVQEENFWTLWCKGRLTEADTPTIQLGATPSGLTSADLHHAPILYYGPDALLPPNQQCQSTVSQFLIRSDSCQQRIDEGLLSYVWH